MTNDITTSVPDITWTNQGVSLPAVSDVLDGVLTDMDASLGGGMSKDLRTPQGQIATSNALIITRAQAWFAALVNQIDPTYSSGKMQDGIGKMYFLKRNAGKGTVVKATCQGISGTIIPQGSVAQDSNGYKYTSLSQVMIGTSGNVDVEFQNITNGAIPCGVNELNNIVSLISGWSSVFNSTAGVLGSDVESRQSFETRRARSVEKNAFGTVGAIEANVADVDGVIDWYIYENFTDQDITIGSTSFPIKKNSIYVCVSGGASTDIAMQILKNKGCGCNVNGDTTVILYDTSYNKPYPEYKFKYQQASPTDVYFKVEITNDPSLPSDIVSIIQKSIISTFTGEDGSKKARIGSSVSAGNYYASLYNTGVESLNVQLIELSLDNANWSQSVTVGVEQQPTISSSNITVTLL